MEWVRKVLYSIVSFLISISCHNYQGFPRKKCSVNVNMNIPLTSEIRSRAINSTRALFYKGS